MRTVTLFVCGDVMTGRGIDQILPHPGDPRLFESCAGSALEYVELAEATAGPIPRRVSFDYLWGAALGELERLRPDTRIVNLETAITVSPDAWPEKAVNYRMHPANMPCLTVADIDCCVLANNHVLDWGRGGLEETLNTLHAAGIQTAGAGADEAEAASPAVIEVSGGARVLVYGFAAESSGVPREWRATCEHSGVNLLSDRSAHDMDAIDPQISLNGRREDIVVASIHWGGNWGYEIPREERELAHRLIDTAGVDLVHGHSSHHVKGIEIYQRKLILYGCGDLLNDYEGIGGYEAFRSDLALMYFPTFDAPSGDLVSLTMIPTRTHRFQINEAEPEAVSWLSETLNRECRKLGARALRQSDGVLVLKWE